jgi:cytochrome c-type biogenesis protein CcsB
MTNETLATYSNYSIYSAMVVLLLAMLAFAVDLAGVTTRRKEAAPAAPDPDDGVREDLLLMAAGRTRTAAATTGGSTTLGEGSGVPGAPGGGDAAEGSGGSEASAEPEPGRRQWAGIGMSLTWLGLLLMVACCALRGLSVSRPPLGNMYEFANVGSTFVLLVFSVYALKRDLRWLGLFVVGPVLLTLGLSVAVFYTQASQLLPSLHSYWLMIHVTVATLSVAIFTIGFSVSILYLVQAWLERIAPEGLTGAKARVHAALPPSRSLDRTAYGMHVVAFPLWTFTLIAGAIWAEVAWGHYWNWDPKEVWTFVIWVVYAAYLHARATTGWNERKAAYLALAGYACILVNYMVVNVYFVGQHSYSGM